MKEKALFLGDETPMLAIVTEPAEAPPAGRPTVLLLNAGITHRVGPHRQTVRLARGLAAQGFRAVRFDLSGIGDSEPRRAAVETEPVALADIQEVMDDLEKRHGTHRFVLGGLCSGADNSFYTAVIDERVVGAFLLDGIAYRTRRYLFKYYGGRARRLRSWLTLARGVARRAVAPVRKALRRNGNGEVDFAPAPAQPDYIREFEPRNVVAEKLQGLVDRGVQMYWIYTSGMREYYNYAEQFNDFFRSVQFKGCVKCDFFGDSNHTFTELRNQRRLVEAVTSWVDETF